MKTVKVITGQSLFDICLQYYGTLAEISTLARDNGSNYDAELLQGDDVLIRTDIQIGNYDYRSFFERSGFIPVSGIDNIRTIVNFILKSGSNLIFKSGKNFIFKK